MCRSQLTMKPVFNSKVHVLFVNIFCKQWEHIPKTVIKLTERMDNGFHEESLKDLMVFLTIKRCYRENNVYILYITSIYTQ